MQKHLVCQRGQHVVQDVNANRKTLDRQKKISSINGTLQCVSENSLGDSFLISIA